MAHRERGERPTVLVTGAGGTLAVSIFKSFRQSALAPRIVATDAKPRSVGLFRADAAYVLPAVVPDERPYLDRLREICLVERVDLVCFGSDVELRRVAPHADEVFRATGARLIVNRPAAVDTFLDKWLTACALRENDLPVPDTVLASDGAAVPAFLAQHSFPLVVKPRHGSGSKNLFVVHGQDELEAACRWTPEPVLQEYLLPDDEEYTVGIYRSPRRGYVGQIVLRRSLGGGLTYKAEVVRDEAIEATCRRLVDAFDLWGPVNVQLRKTAQGVRVFEINPRFSGSGPMRAYFGFNEAELCLRDLLLDEPLAQPEIRGGCALRFWDELYLAPDECSPAEGPLPAPRGTRVADF